MMFSVVQIPLADCRSFISDTTYRIPRPVWPVAEPDREFVRSFGAVTRRRRGGVRHWAGEDQFASARRGVLFYDFGSPRLLFRRLFSDGGAVTRLEFGFKSNLGLRKYALLGLMVENYARRAMDASVFTREDRQPGPLKDSGKRLAEHYLRSTTQNGNADRLPAWWVGHGRPVVVTEYLQGGYWRETDALPVVDSLQSAGIELRYRRDSTNGIVQWFLGYDTSGTDFQKLRQLRLHLLRLHAERECLRYVIREIAVGHLSPKEAAADRLDFYLLNTAKALGKEYRYGLPQGEILSSAYRADLLANEEDMINIMSALERSRFSVRVKVADLLQGLPSGAAQAPIQFAENMTNINIGNNNQFLNSTVAGGITGSFNKIAGAELGEPLKMKLLELTEEIRRLSAKVDDEIAVSLTTSLITVAEQANAGDAPDKSILSRSLGAIRDVALRIGTIGLPLLGLLADLDQLLKIV